MTLLYDLPYEIRFEIAKLLQHEYSCPYIHIDTLPVIRVILPDINLSTEIFELCRIVQMNNSWFSIQGGLPSCIFDYSMRAINLQFAAKWNPWTKQVWLGDPFYGTTTPPSKCETIVSKLMQTLTTYIFSNWNVKTTPPNIICISRVC